MASRLRAEYDSTPLHALNTLAPTGPLTKNLTSHRPSQSTLVACPSFSQELQPRSRTQRSLQRHLTTGHSWLSSATVWTSQARRPPSALKQRASEQALDLQPSHANPVNGIRGRLLATSAKSVGEHHHLTECEILRIWVRGCCQDDIVTQKICYDDICVMHDGVFEVFVRLIDVVVSTLLNWTLCP